MKLAIFDFDKTLFQVDTLPFLLSRWKLFRYSRIKHYKVFFSVAWLYVAYKTGITKLTREEMKLKAVDRFNRIFKGMTEKEILIFFNRCFEHTQELMNRAVLTEFLKAKDEGYHTVLLSGAYTHFINYIGEFLEFDTVIGTKMYFNNDIYDVDRQLEMISGGKKLEKIQEAFKNNQVDWKNSLSFADSYSDLKILEIVGNPVAVNPDRKLKQIAKDRGWKII